MAARERRPQSQDKPELHVPVEIDKEKLKKAFDFSHFDINAILRGIELTLVGGKADESRRWPRPWPSAIKRGTDTDIVQPTELFRIQACSPLTTTDRLLLPWQLALPSVWVSASRSVPEATRQDTHSMCVATCLHILSRSSVLGSSSGFCPSSSTSTR